MREPVIPQLHSVDVGANPTRQSLHQTAECKVTSAKYEM